MVSVTDAAQEVEAQAKQSEASKKATLAKLKKKKLAEKTFKIFVNGEELEMTYRAIGHEAYDKLVGLYPPTVEEKAEGANYNGKGFPPALVSAVALDPKISEEDAREIWQSSDWSRGDLLVLFGHAMDICNTGFNVDFTAGV